MMDYFVKKITSIGFQKGFFKFPKNKVASYITPYINPITNIIPCQLNSNPALINLKFDKNINFSRLYLGRTIMKQWYSNVNRNRRFIKIEITPSHPIIYPLIDSIVINKSIKGEIGVLAIKQLITACSMGYMHIYNPEPDSEGIDFMVTMEKKRVPIKLQIKTCFGIRMYTKFRKENFVPEDNFYIVLLHYSLQNLRLSYCLYLIPSKKISSIATGQTSWYYLDFLFNNPHRRFFQYRLDSRALVSELFDIFRDLN